MKFSKHIFFTKIPYTKSLYLPLEFGQEILKRPYIHFEIFLFKVFLNLKKKKNEMNNK